MKPVLKWAVAAAIVLGTGIGIGRFAVLASADAERIRAAIEPAIREQLQTELTLMLKSESAKTAARSWREAAVTSLCWHLRRSSFRKPCLFAAALYGERLPPLGLPNEERRTALNGPLVCGRLQSVDETD